MTNIRPFPNTHVSSTARVARTGVLVFVLIVIGMIMVAGPDLPAAGTKVARDASTAIQIADPPRREEPTAGYPSVVDGSASEDERREFHATGNEQPTPTF